MSTCADTFVIEREKIDDFCDRLIFCAPFCAASVRSLLRSRLSQARNHHFFLSFIASLVFISIITIDDRSTRSNFPTILPFMLKGTCRCILSETQRPTQSSRRRQREEQKGVSEGPVANVVLVVENDPSADGDDGSSFIWLCRWSSTGYPLKIDNILCFHKSASVHRIKTATCGGGEPPMSFQEVVAPHHFSCQDVTAYAVETHWGGIPCLNQHSHVIIRRQLMIFQDEFSQSIRGDCVVAIAGSPVPLVSMVIRATGHDVDGSSSPTPLRQASWKRQLVGSIIMFHPEKYTTTIELVGSSTGQKRVSLSVESVAARSTSRQNLFVILPSTRISLHSTSADPVGTNYNLTLTPTIPRPSGVSLITQLLLHTALCTNQRIPVPRTFLLSGPPGVGKTYAVKQLMHLCPFPIKLVSLRGSEILQTTHSNNAAQSLQLEFQKGADATTPPLSSGENHHRHTIAIIFLDECDALVGVDAMAAMLATLLDKVATEWTQLLVVGATNRIDSIPGYLRRAGRFDKEIPLTPPNAKERANILSMLIEPESSSKLEDGTMDCDDSLTDAARNEIQRVAELCVGYVPADLNALVRKASLLAAREEETHERGAAVIYQLESAMSEVGPSALRDASLSSPPKITWDDIAGDPGGAKTALRQAIEWPRTKAASFARLGLIPPRGILLHGPPGCAKTTLARAAAGASGVAFLSLSPAEVYASSYVGEAEAVVRRAFSLARSAAPCVLFFDELDSIFGGMQDGGRGSSAEARVLSTFLNEMDGIDNNRGADGVLVLGATNRPWTLDSALLRPGRLGDKIIYIPPPDSLARHAILEMQFREQRDTMDLDWLSSDAVTGLMTGAELVGACQEAKLEILRHLIQPAAAHERDTSTIQEHLVRVLRSKKPLLSDPVALKEFRLFEQHTGKQ